jgi:uncharacterized membrane protein YhfC
MEFSSIIICFIINLIICFGIPLGFLIYLIAFKRDGLKPFFIGALVFLISQVFLRLPIIQYLLPKMEWYNTFSAFYPVMYCIFLGITAGIFEEIGRFLGFKLALKKKRSSFHGLAFGIGHGGIEAILLAGLSNLQNLIILFSLNNGTYDSSKFGSSEEKLREIFNRVTSMDVLAGGIERIFAILIHIGCTFIVLYGINKRKNIYLALAIILHGAVDAIVAILVSIGFSMIFIELFCGIFAVLLLIFSIKIWHLEKNNQLDY